MDRRTFLAALAAIGLAPRLVGATAPKALTLAPVRTRWPRAHLPNGNVYQHAAAVGNLHEGDWVTLNSDMHAARCSATERPSGISLGRAKHGEGVWIQVGGSIHARAV